MTEEKADSFSGLWQDLERRVREKAVVRAKLEPLLLALAKAEEELSPLTEFGSAGRYRLARARVEILWVLRSLDHAGDSPSEQTMHALEGLMARTHSEDSE